MNRDTFFVVKQVPHRPYVRDLLRRLPPGFRIGLIEERNADGTHRRYVSATHPAVLKPDGTILRRPDGRAVFVCSTPGSHRCLTSDLIGIRRALRAEAAT